METPYRLKIKIGANEFEAEGPADVVKEQFEAFRELVSQIDARVANMAPDEYPEKKTEVKNEQEQHSDSVLQVNATALSKIMRVEGRVVSLTIRPADLFAAILLILFGHKELRQNDAVTGAEVLDGLKNTGGFSSVTRVDRYLENAAKDGDVIVIGEHRAKRYRLTNAGYTKAVAVAGVSIASVP